MFRVPAAETYHLASVPCPWSGCGGVLEPIEAHRYLKTDQKQFPYGKSQR